MSRTIRYTEHMAPSDVRAARRLAAALKRARRDHPRWQAVQASFPGDQPTMSGPIVVTVEVPA